MQRFKVKCVRVGCATDFLVVKADVHIALQSFYTHYLFDSVLGTFCVG